MKAFKSTQRHKSSSNIATICSFILLNKPNSIKRHFVQAVYITLCASLPNTSNFFCRDLKGGGFQLTGNVKDRDGKAKKLFYRYRFFFEGVLKKRQFFQHFRRKDVVRGKKRNWLYARKFADTRLRFSFP